jgi:transposase
LPIGIERGGLVGPRLTGVIAYLKGVCHASYSTVRKFLRDVVGLTISRGQLANIIAKVSEALEHPYEDLLNRLPDETHLNVDETGHKQNRLRQWIWCFRASLYTLSKIDPTRSGDVLIEVLGKEFNGVLVSLARSNATNSGLVVGIPPPHLVIGPGPLEGVGI